MKKHKFKLTNQRGFTLLESLVGLVIFSIIVFGSGLAISRMINVQKDMNINYIVINEMQNKLQMAMQTTAANPPATLCQSPSLTSNIIVANTTYYISCGTEKITVGATVIEWPILAASTDAAKALSCAQGTISDSCYVVGK